MILQAKIMEMEDSFYENYENKFIYEHEKHYWICLRKTWKWMVFVRKQIMKFTNFICFGTLLRAFWELIRRPDSSFDDPEG